MTLPLVSRTIGFAAVLVLIATSTLMKIDPGQLEIHSPATPPEVGVAMATSQNESGGHEDHDDNVCMFCRIAETVPLPTLSAEPMRMFRVIENPEIREFRGLYSSVGLLGALGARAPPLSA